MAEKEGVRGLARLYGIGWLLRSLKNRGIFSGKDASILVK